jgi:hypothetical protein
VASLKEKYDVNISGSADSAAKESFGLMRRREEHASEGHWVN